MVERSGYQEQNEPQETPGRTFEILSTSILAMFREMTEEQRLEILKRIANEFGYPLRLPWGQ